MRIWLPSSGGTNRADIGDGGSGGGGGDGVSGDGDEGASHCGKYCVGSLLRFGDAHAASTGVAVPAATQN